jgi:hypothetical protein
MSRLRSRDRVTERDSLTAERIRNALYHEVRHTDAEDGADGGGDEVVGGALVDEGLYEMAALRSNGAGHTHLRATLSGEHHEDQEDQQNASGHGEAAEGREQLDEGVAGGVGGFETVVLGRLGVESQGGDCSVERRLDPAGQRRPRCLPALVRDEDVVDLPGFVEERLGRG